MRNFLELPYRRKWTRAIEEIAGSGRSLKNLPFLKWRVNIESLGYRILVTRCQANEPAWREVMEIPLEWTNFWLIFGKWKINLHHQLSTMNIKSTAALALSNGQLNSVKLIQRMEI